MRAEVALYCLEMLMKAIVLYVFQGLFALTHKILFHHKDTERGVFQCRADVIFLVQTYVL